MLAAFLDIKPKSDTHTQTSNTHKPPKGPPSKVKAKPKSQKRERVEPYESGMHAQFKPSKCDVEPCGLAGAYSAGCEGVMFPNAEQVEEPGDPYESYESYEYLVRDDAGAEENDTDSCMTFDDTCSDITDTLSTSPAGDGAVFHAGLLSKRKLTTSEAPVYTGPELWFEDDDFIE